MDYFRELFDVMTFYKPVRIIVEERKNVGVSIGLMVSISIAFLVLSLAISALLDFSSLGKIFFDLALAFAVILFLMVFHIPFASLVVFLVSRAFSKKGDISQIVSSSYFLGACAMPFFLVAFVPFAEFAGILFFILGAVLFLYFVNDSFEAIFGVTHFKSMILLLFYCIVLLVFLVLALYGLQFAGNPLIELPMP